MSDPAPEHDPATVAAVDLGSNSFHIVIARLVDGRLHIVDRMRERVQLAAGLGPDGKLDADSQTRALDCLERFGQRLRGLPPERVRAVGTNALRAAKNRAAFLRRARAALGHNIEVISGREEGRILYRGVAHSMPTTGEHRLVVDIGGGSTECALGLDEEPLRVESLRIGCVSFSRRYFPDGELTRERFKRATLAAQLELEPNERAFLDMGFREAVGSSGSILAIERMLVESGHTQAGISWQGLRTLRKQMVEAKHVRNLDLPGLSDDRRGVVAGGLAILQGIFKSLHIDHMSTSRAALREGLLLEIAGHSQGRDTREQTVRSLARRFAVDENHADRVSRTAKHWANAVADRWGLTPRDVRIVGWAALLHEVGQVLTYSGYHKHGSYLVQYADMPGFTTEGQRYLSALVEVHRRALKPARLQMLRELGGENALRAAVILRLATRLHRGRHPEQPPTPELEVDGNRVTLHFADGWLDDHPMTEADLQEERDQLAEAGFTLRFD